MIAGPLALALALAASPVHPPCLVVNPTTPPQPTRAQLSCHVGNVDNTFGGWRCDKSVSMVDGHPHTYYGLVIVPTPSPDPLLCNEPTEVCTTIREYVCREKTGAGPRDLRYKWQPSELSELP